MQHKSRNKNHIMNVAAATLLALLLICAHPVSAPAAEIDVASRPVVIVGGDRDYPRTNSLIRMANRPGIMSISPGRLPMSWG